MREHRKQSGNGPDGKEGSVKKKIGIVGLGLIGASIALSLKDKVDAIVAVDRSEDTIALALERKIIDAGGQDPEALLRDCDLVILALYPTAIVDYVLAHRGLWRKGQLLLDVAGLKSGIVRTLQRELEDVEFIGTHPMAGREVSGIRAAREELFLGTNFILTPTEKNTPEGLALARELASLLGVGKVFEMTPEEHDELIAYTSHMPHLLALALVGAYEDGSERIVGRSFLDATRVANINEALWAELFQMNKEPLIRQIDKLAEELREYRDLLERGDRAGMEGKMAAARRLKERMSR